MERKEAIEVIKKNWPDSSFTMLREALETLLHELRESEDEKIRKDLLYWLYSYKDGNEAFVPAGDVDVWITYLEKQGEQQDHSKFLDSIQIGDQVTRNEDGVLVNLSQLKRVAKTEDKVEQKPAWSEEDEQYLLVCKNALAKYQVSDKWDATIILQWLENKLKSLRPQNTWKPSDAQMKYLKEACDEHWEPDGLDPLYTLYQDLKRLREE